MHIITRCDVLLTLHCFLWIVRRWFPLVGVTIDVLGDACSVGIPPCHGSSLPDVLFRINRVESGQNAAPSHVHRGAVRVNVWERETPRHQATGLTQIWGICLIGQGKVGRPLRSSRVDNSYVGQSSHLTQEHLVTTHHVLWSQGESNPIIVPHSLVNVTGLFLVSPNYHEDC